MGRRKKKSKKPNAGSVRSRKKANYQFHRKAEWRNENAFFRRAPNDIFRVVFIFAELGEHPEDLDYAKIRWGLEKFCGGVYRGGKLSEDAEEFLVYAIGEILGHIQSEFADEFADDDDFFHMPAAPSRPEVDSYEVLGLEQRYDATPEEIRSAYRKLARQYHPDKLGAGADDREVQEAIERTQEINAAYETLSDDVTRRAHDAEWRAYERTNSGESKGSSFSHSSASRTGPAKQERGSPAALNGNYVLVSFLVVSFFFFLAVSGASVPLFWGHSVFDILTAFVRLCALLGMFGYVVYYLSKRWG